jgi:CRP/FNR family transcriptional regulator, cyclic AMP receptor protein
VDAYIHEFLRETFGCSTDTAMSICLHVHERRYPLRATIVKQGDRATMTFLLVDGRVHALAYTPEGQTVLLQEFLSGDFFGAIVETRPEPAAADLVAVEAVRAAAFLIADFLMLIERHGCVGLVVSRMLLKQLRSTAAKMAERTTLSAGGRVHAELLRLARLGDGRTIRPAPVVAALAVRVQTTRETASRAINALERRGIIRRERKALVIVAPQRLEEMIV